MSSFGSVLASIDADNHRKMYEETWGHLAPKKGSQYDCVYIWAVGERGDDELNPTLIYSKTTLSDSPWEFDFFARAISHWGDRYGTRKKPYGKCWKSGVVVMFCGTFKNYRAEGTLVRLADYSKAKQGPGKVLSDHAVYETEHEEEEG